MNYQRIYDEIINNAKSRGLNKKKLDGYYEKHHIVPRCLNGTNDKENLVLLTGREHYLCHWLLWKLNKEERKLFTAYHKMVHCKDISQQRNFNVTSKQYEILRLNISNICSERFKNSIPWNKGKHGIYSAETLSKIGSYMTPERIENIRISRLGQPSQMKGKKHTEESKQKMRNSKRRLYESN